MQDLSSALFWLSGGLTIFYYIVKSFLIGKATVLKIVTYIYYLLLLSGVTWMVYSNTSHMCGEIQWVYGLVYGVVPWLFIFGAFSVVLYMFPGWKSPFSNTFGYLYAKIRGVADVINKVVNSDFKSKDIQDIYNDPSMLVNTLTPKNFDSGIASLVRDKIFNPSRDNYLENIEKLRNIVTVKDYVSECIWKLLVSGLISSMSSSQLANIECEYSVDQMRSNEAKHAERVKQKAADAKKNKVKEYIVRD